MLKCIKRYKRLKALKVRKENHESRLRCLNELKRLKEEGEKHDLGCLKFIEDNFKKLEKNGFMQYHFTEQPEVITNVTLHKDDVSNLRAFDFKVKILPELTMRAISFNYPSKELLFTLDLNDRYLTNFFEKVSAENLLRYVLITPFYKYAFYDKKNAEKALKLWLDLIRD